MTQRLQEWAREIEPHSYRLGSVERQLFAHHPDILRAIDDDERAFLTGTDRDKRVPGVLVFLGMLLLIITPIFGVAVYGEHDYLASVPRTNPDTYIAGTAVSFAITAVVLIVMAVRWLRSGARWNAMLLVYAAFAGTMGIFATVGLPTRAGYDGVSVPVWALTPAPVAATIAVALVVAIVARYSTKNVAPGNNADAETVLTYQVRQLPADERKTLLQARSAALDVLADRGIVGDRERQLAQSRKLGFLHRAEAILRQR
ncbi:hypothetical protein [Microbacterium sp. YY-01]|uniref:hypothetical protein n=1 Tax=Microbacterium sp. YY-01 TaxID=3421634 RepID=UPI003D165EEA